MCLEDILKQGANARASGLTAIDNPFYKRDAMPVVTKEPLKEWHAKAKAWYAGWVVEDLLRD